MSISSAYPDRRGGYHPSILPKEVEDFLVNPKFHHRLAKMKVGASVQAPFFLTPAQSRALQERIWRLNEGRQKEFRTFKSKQTGRFFIFRIA